MTTITIQTNTAYANKLYRKLKEDKNLNKVMIEKKSKSTIVASKEISLTMPGTPIDEDALLKVLTTASRTRSISAKEARKRTNAKIAAWRKKP